MKQSGKKQIRTGRGPVWALGILIGCLVLVLGSALLAWLIHSGNMKPENNGSVRWAVISLGLLVGCIWAAAKTGGRRLLCAALTGGAILGILTAAGTCLGAEPSGLLPYAAGIAAVSALFGTVVCAGSGRGYKF